MLSLGPADWAVTEWFLSSLLQPLAGLCVSGSEFISNNTAVELEREACFSLLARVFKYKPPEELNQMYVFTDQARNHLSLL